MRYALALALLLPLLSPFAASALDLGDLTTEVAVNPILTTGGTTPVSIGVKPDGTKPSREAMAKEFARRSAKFAEAPQTNIPGEMWLYSEMSLTAPKLVIPTSELLRVIKNRGGDMGGWAQVYCPYWDKVGYIDTMQACAYKGVTSVDFNKVNFKLYTNGVGFTNGNEDYNFPESPDWGDVKNDPDKFKPDVKPIVPGETQVVSTGCPNATRPATPATPVTPTQPANPIGTTPATGTPSTGSTSSTPPATTPPPATPAAPLTPAIGGATNQHKGALTMRGGKALASEALLQIPAGGAVELLENDGQWCKVRYAGKEGFVRAYYLGLEKK